MRGAITVLQQPWRVREVALAAFVVALICFGGTAQVGRAGDLIVRTAAFAALAVVLLELRPRAPLDPMAVSFWSLLLAIPLLQLVPLPPAILQMLGGQPIIVEGFALTGIAQPWLALSARPDLTRDALFFLAVPFAAFTVAATTDRTGLRALLGGWMLAALLSIGVAILQLMGGAQSPLRFYTVTNDIGALGFFSNRNHFGLFMALSIPVAAYLANDRADGRSYGGVAAAIGFALVALAMILLTVSRSAVLLGILAVLLTGVAHTRSRRMAIGVAVSAASVIGGGLALFGGPVAQRLMTGGDGGRADIVPQLLAAARDAWPAGHGIGSFATIFPRYETIDTLVFSHWNHAHNDWLQIAIEGGALALVAFGLFLVWFGRTLVMALCGAERPQRDLARLAAIATVLILAQSAIDYPARTGAIAALLGLLAGTLGNRAALVRR